MFPDIFIISPFSAIGAKLREKIPDLLINECNKHKIEKSKIHKWAKINIGTVHTFQGKQAEAVILCLGLDNKSKGAANWVSSKPNLLNVALTRAKYRFITIGDKEIWLTQPYFSDLKELY